MLKITKQVATETDAEVILGASYSLSHPFGIPTLIIDPADYHPSLFETVFRPSHTVENALAQTLTRFAIDHLEMTPSQANAHLAEAASRSRIVAMTNKIAVALSPTALAAHAFQSVSPTYNVVICPKTRDAATRIMKGSLCMKEEFIADMPGYDAQWNFFKLWHEFGHGLFGSREDRAERAGACTYRHAFEDTTVLAAIADIRAAQAVLWYDKNRFQEKYGWPLVDVIDSVTDMVPPATWGETVAAANHYAFQNPYIQELQYLGGKLRSQSLLAFNNRDFDLLALICDKMLYKGEFEAESQMKITQRFSIAAQRLSIGTRAYRATTPGLTP